MSPDKWGGLPAPHTDSIFCVIGAELGLVGAALILLLVFVMAARSFKIAERSGTALSWLLACGIGALLGLQSLLARRMPGPRSLRGPMCRVEKCGG